MKIHAALMTMNELSDIVSNITAILPWVDSVTIVDGGSTDGTIPYFRNWTRIEPKIRYFIHPWQDNFPAQRNNYLARVREIAAPGDWVAAFDPDEFFSAHALESLRGLPGRYGVQCDLIGFRCDSVTMVGAQRGHVSQDQYWKPLMFRFGPHVQYMHDGKGAVHERLTGLTRPMAETPYVYEHRKQENVTWPRGVRNYFIGGGGPNLGSDNPRWVAMRAIASALGIETWAQMHAYLLRGNIADPLRNWILEHRHADGWDGSSEQREWAKSYFRLYHPEEEPESMRGETIK